MQCIALDSHKHYRWALVQDEAGKVTREQRIDHVRGTLRGFLEEFEWGTPVAVETIGDWYWVTDEIDALRLTRALPGVAFILGVVILTEVGVVDRFPSPSHLASYSGMIPRVHASGGKARYGLS